MASNADKEWQKNILCRYYSAGMCRAGESCPFSHDWTLSNRGTIQCKFYRHGTCAFGEQCRFSHGTPSGPPEHFPVPSTEHVLSCQNSSTVYITDSSWANAPEFIPQANVPTPDSPTFKPKAATWAQIVNPIPGTELSVSDAESQLCAFYISGECRYGQFCSDIHGDLCELCRKCILHPTHQLQRKEHHKACLRQHEANMELAFAMARSKDKVCGICMDVVIKKPKSEARFGILPKCNHCFCLQCIRKWRQAKQFEQKVIRSCPECRQTSDYICPSQFWVDTKEEKDKLLHDYKLAMNKMECKYFKASNGKCPFGNKCFYRHVGPDGKPVDLGPPQKRQMYKNANGELSFLRSYLLFDFLEERDGGFVIPSELLDFFDFLSGPLEADE